MSAPRGPVTFLTTPGGAAAELPFVLVLRVTSELQRRAALRSLVAGVTNIPADQVLILHEPHNCPIVVVPRDCGVFLSSASRDGVAALAVARVPVGIDVEIVTGKGDVPWNVLHPDERAVLAALPASERNDAFLKLWTAKEAYYKALISDFSRDPTEFAVNVTGETATVRDPSFPGRVDIVIRPFRVDEVEAFVSVALVAP